MEHSESIKELATALSKAQGEIENAAKNAANPHFKSRYADLAEIINTVRPVLAAHGLAIVQIPGFVGGVVTVDTLLTHSSGQWIRGTSGAPIGKPDPQGVGSATTYLRRYSLAAVCGIAQEDDDGNAASSPVSRVEAKTVFPATDNQLKLIRRVMVSRHITDTERAGIQKRIDAGMSKEQASEAIDWLNTTIDERKRPSLEEEQLAGVGVTYDENAPEFPEEPGLPFD